MFALSNFLVFLARVIRFVANPVLTIYAWIIIARALISWVNPDPYNPIVQFLGKVTEPVLTSIKRIIPVHLGIGIDISPLIALLFIYMLQFFLNDFLAQTLLEFAFKVR